MVSIKPLVPVLASVGVLAVAFGYFKAYWGPFFVVSLQEAGYALEQIARIQLTFTVLWMVCAWAGIIAVALVSYRYGAGYKLTRVTGSVLIILAYLAEMLGNLLGTVVYQIQVPQYPILQATLLEVLASHGYVYVCLIGVLAANYVRELKQQEN